MLKIEFKVDNAAFSEEDEDGNIRLSTVKPIPALRKRKDTMMTRKEKHERRD